MRPDLQEIEVKNIKQREGYDTQIVFRENSFHAALRTNYRKSINNYSLYEPNEMGTFCNNKPVFPFIR